MTDSFAEYDRRAAELASRYETLDFEAVHESILDRLPPDGSRILDVGAGSGRDAAWLARHGYEVTAVEPSAGMRKEASALGRDGSIRWIDDVLPALSVTHRTGLSFDFILLSGVWMHIRPDERQRGEVACC